MERRTDFIGGYTHGLIYEGTLFRQTEPHHSRPDSKSYLASNRELHDDAATLIHGLMGQLVDVGLKWTKIDVFT